MGVDEIRLLKAIGKDRNTEAFSELYDHCAPIAYSLAMRILRNEAEAEDVLQQAFLSLWQNASKFDEKRGKVTTWLYVFVRNRCIDLVRRKKHENHFSIDQNTDDGAKFELVDGSPLWEITMNGHERSRAVSEALKRLPDVQRSVIEAAYFDGLTQQEIADKFREPLGTVKTRMRLGMMKLTKHLKVDERVLNEP